MSVELLGLDINGTCLDPPVKGAGGMQDVVEARVEGLGGSLSRNTQKWVDLARDRKD
jgi:hypothetical protein